LVPSALSAGSLESASPIAPLAVVARLASIVCPAARSRTCRSYVTVASPSPRLVAAVSNATRLPSPEMDGD
jgi:hypothetical protein